MVGKIRLAHLGVDLIDQAPRRAQKAPDHACELLGSLGLVVGVHVDVGREGAAGGAGERGFADGARGPDHGYLAVGLEDGAVGAVEHEPGLDARLLGESVQHLLYGLCVVGGLVFLVSLGSPLKS